MPDPKDFVFVKAHVRKKPNKEPFLYQLIALIILLGILGFALNLFFRWLTAGGWIIIVAGLFGFTTIYCLIRWRRQIFGKALRSLFYPTAKASVNWKVINSTKDYPLWLIFALYQKRYNKHINEHTYIFNGVKWEYKIIYWLQKTEGFRIEEPSDNIGNITIYKRLRGNL